MKNNITDDDNRVIADMSMIEKPTLMGIFFGRRFDAKPKEKEGSQKKIEELSKEDQRAYMLAAMKAGLLIGFVYVAVIGLFIAGVVFLWKTIG